MAGLDALRGMMLPIGLLRHALFAELGPGWLPLDGATSHRRTSYPEFVARAAGLSWFLAGPDASTFRLRKVPAGTATVASGFEIEAGTLIGSDRVQLTADMLPEHDHAYTDSSMTAAAGKASLLTGIAPLLTGATAATADKRTAKAGQASPAPVPIRPPGIVAHLFVFAGRPRP